MAVTLNDIIVAARTETNTLNSGFFDDTVEMPQYVNDSVSAVYDRIVGAYEQYFATTSSFSLTSSNTIALTAITLTGPAFYKELGVNFMSGGLPVTVQPIGSYTERNRGNIWGGPFVGGPNLSYFINGANLEIYPSTSGFAGSYQLVYVGNVPTLTDLVDLPVELERWKRLVILETTLLMKQKREQDTDAIERKIAVINAEIDAAARHRKKEGKMIPARGTYSGGSGYGPWGW